MGRPDLADDARFAERRERIRNGAECNAIIAEWSASHTKRAIYEACYAGGCPVGPFYDAKEIAEDPQMVARGFFVEADHAAAGAPALPVRALPFPRYAVADGAGRAAPWRAQRPCLPGALGVVFGRPRRAPRRRGSLAMGRLA